MGRIDDCRRRVALKQKEEAHVGWLLQKWLTSHNKLFTLCSAPTLHFEGQGEYHWVSRVYEGNPTSAVVFGGVEEAHLMSLVGNARRNEY